MKKKKFAEKVSGILPDISRSKGWEVKLDLYSIFPRWEELVGEQVANCTRPWKFEKTVLWIEVENSAWMQQLQYEKIGILERLNAALRFTRLTDIRMVLPKPSQNRFPDQKAEPQKIQFVRPPQEDVKAFREKVDGIDDSDCREALFRFWYLSMACKREENGE